MREACQPSCRSPDRQAQDARLLTACMAQLQWMQSLHEPLAALAMRR